MVNPRHQTPQGQSVAKPRTLLFDILVENLNLTRRIPIVISWHVQFNILKDDVSTWWRHQMETFCALLAICAGNSPAPGEFPAQRPVTRSFDVFFDLRLNKRLSKHSWGWWFETPPCPLWRHSNGHTHRFVNNLNLCQARNKGSLCQTSVKTMVFLMIDIFQVKLDLPIHFPLTITKPTKQLHTASVELVVVHTCSQAWFSQAGNIEK